MFRLTLPALCLLLASCSSRPETTDYFTKVTGLPLCTGATIRNINADSPGRSPGFDSIYIVDVTMPATCKASFVKAVVDRIGAACEPLRGCSGNSSTGEYYGVQPSPDGFRITYAT